MSARRPWHEVLIPERMSQKIDELEAENEVLRRTLVTPDQVEMAILRGTVDGLWKRVNEAEKIVKKVRKALKP